MNNIEEILTGTKSLAISGHIRPDGDCVGSCLGLYNYVVDNFPEIDVDVYLEKPGNEFSYIRGIEIIKNEPTDKVYDLFIVLDCSDTDRILPFISVFEKARKTFCIDHHVSNLKYADENIVDGDASSTCEVLYRYMDNNLVSKAAAEAIYTGIIHDTGVFKYSSTSCETMLTAGKLMDKGIDFSSIIDNSFYKKTYIQNKMLGYALSESVLFYDGKCIFASIPKSVLDENDISGKELGGIVEQLRLTDGVEVAIFMYELEEGEYKISMRSKKYVDVSVIAVKFGGGGHVRASGCNIKGDVFDIVNTLGEEIKKQLKD